MDEQRSQYRDAILYGHAPSPPTSPVPSSQYSLLTRPANIKTKTLSYQLLTSSLGDSLLIGDIFPDPCMTHIINYRRRDQGQDV